MLPLGIAGRSLLVDAALNYPDSLDAERPRVREAFGVAPLINSHTVTRIIVPFVGYAGRYVWHCHLLEHEENENMCPYDIQPG